MKVRDFIKQLEKLGCVATNQKGADQTWRTPKGNAFFLKVNKLGDDISVGTLAGAMKTLKRDGFYLENGELKAKPEAYEKPEKLEVAVVEKAEKERRRERGFRLGRR